MTKSNIAKDLPNKPSRSTAETAMNPTGQTIPVIHPHLEGKSEHLSYTTRHIIYGYNMAAYKLNKRRNNNNNKIGTKTS